MAYSITSRFKTSPRAGAYQPPKTPRGPILLQESGLRSYSPGLGRWASRDPTGEQASLHLYAYVANGPTYYIDILGLTPILPVPRDPGLRPIAPIFKVPEPDFPPFPGLPPGGTPIEMHPTPAPIRGIDPHYQPPPPWFIGGEFGPWLGLGGGLQQVTCCDEDKTLHEMNFAKVCFGFTGASALAGNIMGMDGERCDPDTYVGWFLEVGASLGVAAGIDIGLEGEVVGYIGGRPIFAPHLDLSGVIEGGIGIGLPGVNLAYCHYVFLNERTDPCGCE